jgi:hypothetical protein
VVLPLLMPALGAQIQWRERMAENPKNFIPEWPHLSTWLNQRRWEDEQTIQNHQLTRDEKFAKEFAKLG